VAYLPAKRAVIDPRKLADYVLNPEHPIGGAKARVFRAALGIGRADAISLAAQIREGLMTNPAIPGKVDHHGSRFSVDIEINGPKGSGVVRTGWIVALDSDLPRLVTAFVKGGRNEAGTL
jgi:hypothetical protein